MAEKEQQESRVVRNERRFWFAIPILVLVAFVVWILSKMGAQSTGTTLGRLLIGMAVILGLAGLGYWLMSRRSQD